MRKSILAFLGLLLFASTTQAQICLDSDPKQKEILNRFSWYSKDPELKPDFCDPKNLAYRVANALLFLKSAGKLDHSKTDQFDRSVLGSDPLEFFSGRIRTLQFDPDDENDDDQSGCDGYTAAYVNAATKSGVMHICRHLGGLDALTISSALIHEARHQDSYHQHAICNHGFMIGQAACDESYSSGDSYSVQTEYFVKVSRSGQITPAIRQTARDSAIEYFSNRFNALPLGIKKGAALLTSDSKLVFYDGESVTPMMSLKNSAIQMYQSGDLLKFYDPIQRVLSQTLDGVNLETLETNHDMDLDHGKGRFVDRYWTQRADCWLYTNRLICDFHEKKLSLPITDFTPVGFQSYSLSDRFEKKVRIVSKEGQVYAVTAASTEFSGESTNNLNTGAWDSSTTIGLSFDGRVYFETQNGGRTLRKPAPGLSPNGTYIKMIAPYYWSKELQKL
ncbi:MAG: hypothetical protein ACJ763_20275 [Bdellovibrionia bacterium]